jgi:chitin-binding protein
MFVRRVARTAFPALLALALIAPEAGAARNRSQPAAPANLRITASTSSSVTLAWDASKSGSGIAYYTVLEKSTWTHFNVPASQTSYTRTRLWPNINHSWIVYAVDTKGNDSAESNTVTYRTPPDTTPPSTPSLSAPFVGPTRVQLDWTDSVDDVSGVTYTVNIDGSPAQTASLSGAVVPDLVPSTS